MPRCPKCQDSMEEGFVLDNSEATRLVSSWCSGKPRRGFWLGVKVSGLRQIKIESWRCTRCGFLENFAPS
jgi:Domain of unknown function (DUF6487)